MAVESAIQLMLSFGILIVAILTLAHNFTNKKSKNAPDSYILAFLLFGKKPTPLQELFYC
ncbi:competence inhibitor ComI [Bacillus amyloliquefaciens]|uniref:competence inhibitor ComI n=1 Tax=Bacillus amyloliquefaciens TaxID=1390 RepID=UPI001872401F|nr:putative holin-like toxin [Bacillus amyloliquefaciens]QOQ56739.1 hypothetical protein IL989_08905 [Bacillus amyloliquefaciens]